MSNVKKKFEKFLVELENDELYELSVIYPATFCRKELFYRFREEVQDQLKGYEYKALREYFESDKRVDEIEDEFNVEFAQVSRKLTNILKNLI